MAIRKQVANEQVLIEQAICGALVGIILLQREREREKQKTECVYGSVLYARRTCNVHASSAIGSCSFCGCSQKL
jgi:hypothetical protein